LNLQEKVDSAEHKEVEEDQISEENTENQKANQIQDHLQGKFYLLLIYFFKFF
jgi:hypothetical protein